MGARTKVQSACAFRTEFLSFEYFYFVMALQSTSGFYVSYAKGTLPFDARNDEVYAVGFHYKF